MRCFLGPRRGGSGRGWLGTGQAGRGRGSTTRLQDGWNILHSPPFLPPRGPARFPIMACGAAVATLQEVALPPDAKGRLLEGRALSDRTSHKAGKEAVVDQTDIVAVDRRRSAALPKRRDVQCSTAQGGLRCIRRGLVRFAASLEP